ncbi:MAG: OmpW/AlkL family protein [Gammaproteobacteria bacterium]
MQYRALKSVLALALVAATPLAGAYEQGQFLARAGYAAVAPNSASDSALGDIVEVEDGSSLGIAFTYMVTPAIGIEVLGALPFSHDLKTAGPLAGVEIGETKHLPPTVSLQWYPKLEGKLQPYLGAGLNYTVFFDEDTTPELNAALGGATSLELDESLGLALQAGIDYAVNDKWMLNAAVWNIDIDTEADVRVNGVTAVVVDVEIDPWVYMIGAGYRF